MYAIQEIQEVIQATTPRLAFVEASIEHLLLDSRQIIFAERSLFLPLKERIRMAICFCLLYTPQVYAILWSRTCPI